MVKMEYRAAGETQEELVNEEKKDLVVHVVIEDPRVIKEDRAPVALEDNRVQGENLDQMVLTE